MSKVLYALENLPQVVGPSRAAELLFTGDVIDAREAERIGFVSRVVPHEDILSARALAARIAADVGITLGTLFATEDHREGAMAFVEKREPGFKGK